MSKFKLRQLNFVHVTTNVTIGRISGNRYAAIIWTSSAAPTLFPFPCHFKNLSAPRRQAGWTTQRITRQRFKPPIKSRASRRHRHRVKTSLTSSELLPSLKSRTETMTSPFEAKQVEVALRDMDVAMAPSLVEGIISSSSAVDIEAVNPSN
jgi:hypothetical protein